MAVPVFTFLCLRVHCNVPVHQGMATILDKFFTSVAERLKSTQSNQVSLSDVSDVPHLASAKNFELKDISVDFVRKELSSLKVKVPLTSNFFFSHHKIYLFPISLVKKLQLYVFSSIFCEFLKF